jgi:hypothetical protein
MAFPPDRVADQELRSNHFSNPTPHWMVTANFPHKNAGTQIVQIATSVTLAKKPAAAEKLRLRCSPSRRLPASPAPLVFVNPRK